MKLGHKQMYISKLFLHYVNPSSSQIHKISPYTDIKQNIKHTFSKSKSLQLLKKKKKNLFLFKAALKKKKHITPTACRYR